MSDLPLLRDWQRCPHVHKWWRDDEPYSAEDLVDTRVARWIVEINGAPLACLQDYAVHGWGSHHSDYLPANSRGIDQYIGDLEMIGCGHGSAFIRQRVRDLFDSRVSVVGTDPNPENLRAIAVYEKLGFRIAGPEQLTEWGRILPMEACNHKGSRLTGL